MISTFDIGDRRIPLVILQLNHANVKALKVALKILLGELGQICEGNL